LWSWFNAKALGVENTSYGRGGNYGSGGFRSERAKPVEVGKEYEVTITETSRRGDGVARIEGFVIFVAGGRSGQKAKIKVTNVGPRFANATIVESGEESKKE